MTHRAMAVLAGTAALIVSDARADLVVFTDLSGLAAEAEFTLLTPTTVRIRLANTSTGVPMGFDSSDQLLTGLSWDAGLPGVNGGDPSIVSGSAVIGPTSMSLNFSSGAYGPGTDIGGEWGSGNSGISGALPNAISGNTSGITPFGGPNLDDPLNLDGPQAGLVADPILVPVGGLGAIQHEIIAEITLSQSISDLDELLANGVRVEFGSDAAFITVPAPASLALLGVASIAAAHRRRAGRYHDPA
jgi:hypothetical protein